ncbi:MAG: hypothetical protein OHK0024_13650 [Thalassobaculales bacterium]
MMVSQDQIEALKARHKALEVEIQEENARPLPDGAVIADLKRQKLRIKDEINRLAH